MMQRSVDQAGEEKERTDQENERPLIGKEDLPDGKEPRCNEWQESGSRGKNFESKPHEMHSPQDDLRKVKSEREELSRRLEEIEKENIRSGEDLKKILSEKKRIEERNQELQSANEEALNKIRILTQEKEEAIWGENEALEKYLQQLKENDDLAAELNNLRYADEKSDEEMDGEREPAQFTGTEASEEAGDSSEEQYGYDNASVNEAFEEKYGKELVTDSGMELFMMLRGLLQDDAREDNGVRMTRSWEEELEETIPGAYPDEAPITRKVRTRSEVSVEYIAGHKSGI